MISRRSIRVKVMQTLYTLSAGGEENAVTLQKQGGRLLTEKLEHSLDLFTGAILITLRVAQYAETDSARRRSKRLPTAEDLDVPTRIAGNTLLWNILDNATFTQRVEGSKLERFVQEDFIKRVYRELCLLPEYQSYNESGERVPKEEKAIIQIIWDKILKKEDWAQEYFADEMPGWDDDQEMIGMLMDNFFRNPAKVNFLKLISEEKRVYAADLLKSVISREDYIDGLIQPRLQNWDSDRVALIDLILLRMGVAEMLYFPTIPTKVTINEYIDVAKTYSTPQSGQFINGVLDNVLKDLNASGQIQKEDRVKKA